MEHVVIGICDDQEMIIRELQNMILDIGREWNASWEVRTFTVGEEILKQTQELAVVFLDIEMPYMDGIELGKNIRRKNPECKIIMATGKSERFKEAFQIQAMRFVTKPFEREELEEALKAVIASEPGKTLIDVYFQRIKYEIQQADVQYIEAYNGYAEFVVSGKRFRRETSLDDLEEILDQRLFVRIDRKTIVNLRWVQLYKNHCMQVVDRKFVISRRRRKEVESRYIEYDLHYWGESCECVNESGYFCIRDFKISGGILPM